MAGAVRASEGSLGLVSASASEVYKKQMQRSRLTLRYREVESCVDSPVLPKGQRVRGHEFHWSTLAKQPEANESVYKVVDQDNRLDGFRTGNVWASYVHIHLGSRPGLASRFVETCAATNT